MTDPFSVGAALSGIKGAIEVTTALVNVRDEAKLAMARVELLRLLVEAQQAEVALIEDKRRLSERVRELETWDREAERYELANVGSGVIAFALKPEAQGAEPAHLLCANCFKQRRQSYLQFNINNRNVRNAFECHACKSTIGPSGDRLRALGVWPPSDG